MLRKLFVFALVLAFALPGCIDSESVVGSKNDEVPLRLNFEAQTLDRVEDNGSSFELKKELESSPVLLLWVGSSCFGCHDWTNLIRDSLENGSLNLQKNLKN